MESVFMSKPFYYKVWGEYALFTDPMSKGGGEKFTYQVPTYQALKGITEAIYWKPSIIWYVDEVKICNPIATETKGIRALKTGGNNLNYYTYLKKVEYFVKVHFEWNNFREDLKEDRQEIKHQQIMLRSLKKGGRRDIFLGARECVGYVDKLGEEEYEQTKPCKIYLDSSLSFGMMFHSFVYPDEAFNEKTYTYLSSNFTPIVMKRGLISFCRPEECKITRQLHKLTPKIFTESDFTDIDEEYEQGGEV